MAPRTAIPPREEGETEEQWEARVLELGHLRIEVHRAKQMAKNLERLAELRVLEAADDLKQTMDQEKAQKEPKPKEPRRKHVHTTGDFEQRKSSRPKPEVKYFPSEERQPRSEKPPKKRKGVRKAGPPKASELSAEQLRSLLKSDPVKAWKAARGWNDAFGMPSAAAQDAALDAAREFAAQLRAQGRHAFAKCLTESQVCRGFWCSIPRGLVPHYGSSERLVIMLSPDQAHRAPDSFAKDNQRDNSVCWDISFKPRQGGWSGGWVFFSIDNLLALYDSVVFEVLSDQEGDAFMQQHHGSVAKRTAGHGVGRLYVRTHLFRASAYEAAGPNQQQPVAAAAAAAAGQQNGEPAAQPAAAAAAANGGAGSSKQQQGEAAGAATHKKRSRVQDPQHEEQQQAHGRKQKKQKPAAAAAAAAPPAAGAGAAAAAGAKGSKQQGKRPAAAAAGGGAGAKKKSKAAAAELVPQPANKSVLVPPPTAEEIALNASTVDFEVATIMDHKVVRGEDKFLIRWAGFGPYWDSWEGVGCLNQPPRSYSWQGDKQAIPAKFRK